MKNITQDDSNISQFYDFASTEPFYQEDITKIYDFFFSYTDMLQYHEECSRTESTDPTSKIILESDEVRPIQTEINIKFDEEDFLFGSSYQNKLSKKPSIQDLIRVPQMTKSQELIIDSYFEADSEEISASMEFLELNFKKISINVSCDEQVSILFDENTDDKPKPKKSKPIKTLKNKRASKGIRKGKNYQSMTQKFLKFMTHFHFSKNFKQFFKKGIINHKFDPKEFQNYEAEKKIEIIDLIIEKEVKEYKMKMHYSVQNGNFLKGFGPNQENIKDFFHQVVRRVYKLMFETCKRRIMFPENGVSDQGYLDRQAEREFEDAFDEILQTRPYYEELVECDFERRLQEEIEG